MMAERVNAEKSIAAVANKSAKTWTASIQMEKSDVNCNRKENIEYEQSSKEQEHGQKKALPL
jgi:hypothetical protein